MRRKKLVNPGVKYPKSKLVREALIPKRKREHTYTRVLVAMLITRHLFI